MGKWVIKTSGDYHAAMNGIRHHMKRLEKVMATVPNQTIHECLVETLEKSVPRAPVDEGSLRESGHVAVDGMRTARGQVDGSVNKLTTYIPGETAKNTTFEIGYTVEGGGSGREGDVNIYAIVQHEHVEFDHPKGGQAKFLESAIAEDRAKWNQKIKAAVSAAVNGVDGGV